MTTPPSPERHSLYPEPHRVGDWTSPAQRRPRPPMVLILVVGAAVAALLAIIIQAGIMYGNSRGSDTATVTDPNGQEINAIQVQVGTCLVAIPADGRVGRVTAVPCDTPHRAEVVAEYPLSGDAWPGRLSVEDQVLDYCGAFIQPGFETTSMFKPGDWESGLRWVAWLPTEESWKADERSGLCVAYRDGNIVGSFVAGTAAFSN
jgi:hypothetical protein